MSLSPLRTLAATSIVVFAAIAARADDPAGVLWETTSQMVLEGMPMAMPPRTLKICTAPEMTQPPPGGDPSCVTSEFTRDDNKATWKVECGGRMPMKGTGEITYAADGSYSGAIKGTAEGVTMTINLSGRKIGTCDKPIG